VSQVPAKGSSQEARQARASLAEQACRELERRLVTLELEPGQLLQEKQLIDALGIGRTPVREAVQRMAAMRLLEVLPRKGLLVMPIRHAELGQVIETRRVLERLLVVKAAERASQAQRGGLRELAAALYEEPGGPGSFFHLDSKLDETLSACCGNLFLAEALRPLRSHCRRLWYRHRASLDVAEAARLHAHLASAVADGDGAGAIRAMNGIIGILERLHARLADKR
jgi:DNA-binding GntR family transcriptional regulator